MTSLAAAPAPETRRWRLSVPGAALTARHYCQPACFGYHAAWRICRRTGLKGNPRWHVGFYRTALDAHALPAGRLLRVLICAASDETMLAVLARLLPAHRLEVRLVDACRTPLLLAAAYARRHHLTLTTVQAHAPNLPDLDQFDLIATDGLLSLLPHRADADALLARLAAALHPDGLLLYTTRLAGTGGVLEYDRAGRALQSAAFRALWRGPTEQRRKLAEEAWQHRSRPNPFSSMREIAAAFGETFSQVRVHTRTQPATTAQRLHPAARRGATSVSVGVAAAAPRSQP
ncbi:hypothetical protein [Actinoplanes sp. NPDC049118]|uniref:hypothetical protein n=1 Tax=Actinoplanes sp. NPDC049118 TaxID=3155769 RepID=UPI0033D9540F